MAKRTITKRLWEYIQAPKYRIKHDLPKVIS